MSNIDTSIPPEKIFVITLGCCETDTTYQCFKTYTFRTRCAPHELVREVEASLFPKFVEDFSEDNKIDADSIFIHFMIQLL